MSSFATDPLVQALLDECEQRVGAFSTAPTVAEARAAAEAFQDWLPSAVGSALTLLAQKIGAIQDPATRDALICLFLVRKVEMIGTNVEYQPTVLSPAAEAERKAASRERYAKSLEESGQPERAAKVRAGEYG